MNKRDAWHGAIRAAIEEELLDFAALWAELPTSDLQAAAPVFAERIIDLVEKK